MIFQSVYFLNVKSFRSLFQMAENRTMGSTVDNGRAGVSCVSKCLSWCGRRSLVGCSPWGHEESDTTERLHFRFSLSCIGEGNGNPLQSSCLENPRDGGAWWAAVSGVTQSQTRLKRLSSSSSRYKNYSTSRTSNENFSLPINNLFMCMCSQLTRVLPSSPERTLSFKDQRDLSLFSKVWFARACVLVTQSCPTLGDPMYCSPPGSSVHGILQARILEWVAIPFFTGSSWPRDRTQVSGIAVRFFYHLSYQGSLSVLCSYQLVMRLNKKNFSSKGEKNGKQILYWARYWVLFCCWKSKQVNWAKGPKRIYRLEEER